MNSDKYWIALSSIEEIDSRFIQRLYNYYGDIEKAFNAKLSDSEVKLPGVVSRKKQVVPPLTNAFEA